MKIFSFIVVILSLSVGEHVFAKEQLRVFTYDSMMSKKGLGRWVKGAFEKDCNCELSLETFGDAAEMVTRLEFDRRREANSADILWGIDQNLWSRVADFADESGSLDQNVPQKLRIHSAFVPFDYAPFAFMADTKALKERKLKAPTSIRDLLRSEWKRNFVLEDPRTSSPGLGFLVWTAAIIPEKDHSYFWGQIAKNWLALSAGWDQAYQIFLEGEAPLVWSYVTSQAYHQMHGDKDHRYQALVLDEPAPLQIEGAVLLKDSKNKDLARRFLKFLLSKDVQQEIPLRNWMLPVVEGTPVPEAFQNLPNREVKLYRLNDNQRISQLLEKWRTSIQ